MRCHYEVLGVSLKANDDELKKAYRKMALQWHPDKNPDNLEEAKTQFQLIQAAYETLSDPQERAFYDRNRDSILRGRDTEGHGKPDTLDLFQYFTTQCYSGFNDSEKGFYTVYRQVFETIAAMDMKYMDDQEEDIIIPNFGSSDADHEDVAQFYGYWIAYCSSMDFHWADEYDIREVHGLGRWAERKVGKENSKARQKARKQFNEQVRELVAFVRKRDKRWQARKKMLEAKVEENKRKQEAAQQRWREERENRMKEDLEKEKANLAEYEKELEMLEGKFAAEWGLGGSEESEYEDEDGGGEEGEGGMEGEEEELDPSLSDNLYCVACNKSFRTEKSMENHEKSKKHKENIEALKAMMTAEDRRLLQDTQEETPDNGLPPVEKSSKKKKKKNKKNTTLDTTQETPNPTSDTTERKSGKKSARRNKKNARIFSLDSEDSDGGSESVAENDVNKDKSRDGGDAERGDSVGVVENGVGDSTAGNSIEGDSLVENSDSLLGDSKTSSNITRPEVDNDRDDKDDRGGGDVGEEEGSKEDDTTKAKPKLKGKKAKDARKKAQQEASQARENETKVMQCTVCGKDYPSKNKLFAHIKAEGHAALKTIGKDNTKSREKGREKGRNK